MGMGTHVHVHVVLAVLAALAVLAHGAPATGVCGQYKVFQAAVAGTGARAFCEAQGWFTAVRLVCTYDASRGCAARMVANV